MTSTSCVTEKRQAPDDINKQGSHTDVYIPQNLPQIPIYIPAEPQLKERPIMLPPITKRPGLMIDTAIVRSSYASPVSTSVHNSPYATSLSPNTFLDQAFYPASACDPPGSVGSGGMRINLSSFHQSSTPSGGYGYEGSAGYETSGGYFGFPVVGMRPYSGLGIWPEAAEGVPLVFDPNVVLPPVNTREADEKSWDCGNMY
jgi:hypothetical protein